MWYADAYTTYVSRTDYHILLSQCCYRAAAFDVTGHKHPQHPLLWYVLFIRIQGKKVVSSTVILEAQAAYYCVCCHCSAVTMPIKLSSYVTWSANETVASLQLPLNSVPCRFCDINAGTLCKTVAV